MQDDEHAEPPITAFDAASYSYQMTEELRRLAVESGLEDLARALGEARVAAERAMVAARQLDAKSASDSAR